ncbi:hypothetical protein OAI67_02025 [Candidatus Nitrosopelagicus sp.]|nr:hypothetical protein [Candidatus Nitrosopelagicus sp.]
MLKPIFLILLLVPIAQFGFAEEIPDYNKPYAPIFFNKPIYSWTEKVEITIIAPSWNTGMNLIDSIGGDPNYSVNVYTNDYQLKQYKLYETDPSSGIFTGEIILTGFLHDVNGDGKNDTNPRTVGGGPNGGYLQNEEDSGITVSFEFADGVVLSESAKIKWNVGDLRIVDVTEESAKIKLFERDMNLNPESIDTVNIEVFSENDSAGIKLEIAETTEDSGIFEGIITITKDDQSSGNRLYALPDSEITAKYTDRTLPKPYNTNDDLDIFAQENVISNIPTSERLSMNELEILSQNGELIERFEIGQTGMLFSKVKNAIDFSQEFTYIVQIKNEDNNVISLSWVTGETMPSQELGMSVSWMPQEPGKYSIERFVWNSIQGAIPLTDTISTDILIQ